MILKRKLYSEAGKKKLEERARKKANKRKWQIEQAREASDFSWTRGLSSEFGEKHAERKKWLKGKNNEEVLDAIDKKPVKVIKHKGFLGDTTERSYNLPKSVVKEMELGEEALRTGRKSIENQGTKYWDIAKAEKFKKEPNKLMIDVSSGEAGALGKHKLDWGRELDLKDKLRTRKDRLKKIEEEKAKEIAKAARKTKIRKAAPWAIGGSLATAGTIAGIKAIKKKKSKKEEK